MLKTIIIGAAFSALIASSAMAQSYQPEWGSGNIVPGPNGGFTGAPYPAERFAAPYAGAYVSGPYAYERPAVQHRTQRSRHRTNLQLDND